MLDDLRELIWAHYGTGQPYSGRFVSYLRCSTERQGRSGLGMEAQRAAVLGYLNGGNWELAAEHREVESGKEAANRPALAAALRDCELLGATLVIAKLDRLSRNAAFLMTLQDSGVAFVCADMPQANRLTIGLLAVVAQHEREMISQRTKDALAAAKARGVKLGGVRPNHRAVDHRLGSAALSQQSDAFAARVAPVAAELRDRGMSLRQIAAELSRHSVDARRCLDRGVGAQRSAEGRTPRGGHMSRGPGRIERAIRLTHHSAASIARFSAIQALAACGYDSFLRPDGNTSVRSTPPASRMAR